MAVDARHYLNNPITIGGKKVKNRLFLAPMAGLGHVAMRELISIYGGAGLLFSEMCNAKSIPHENRYVSPTFKWRDSETESLVVQIFGSEPEIMVNAARRIEKEGFFGIDINFGCSVRAICNRNCGAALLNQPDLAVKIVSEIRKAVSIPVFVKYRTGWKDDPNPAVDFARRFEDAGADALVFHPRVAPDRRLRAPNWSYVGLVKQAVSIPVFGNGNVFNLSDCNSILETSGCDGISLGRIAIARPWIFSEIILGRTSEIDVYVSALETYTHLLEKHFDQILAVKRYKKTLTFYAANFKYGLKIRPQLIKGETMDDMRENLQTVLAKPPEVNAVPNINLFL